MFIEKFDPTPIQKLGEKLNDNTFYIKRDDLIPISFGGNKVRKAILFYKVIKENGYNSIVTYGSSSSNHCRVISNMAASKKIPCYIVSPSEKSRTTLNSKMIELFAAETIHCPVNDVRDTISRTIENLRLKGYNPYFVQGGGHGNIGTQAYVDAYKEIKNYESKVGIHFDYIFHASGTGTTQAGLICGQIIHGDNRKIVGISNARKNPYGGQVVLNSVNDFLVSISMERVESDVVNFIDDYVLDGYGSYNEDILDTIKELLIKDGIPLDTTYTGKAFWGMKEYIKKNQIKGKNILFIHTGGTPLFFDDLGELINEV